MQASIRSNSPATKWLSVILLQVIWVAARGENRVLPFRTHMLETNSSAALLGYGDTGCTAPVGLQLFHGDTLLAVANSSRFSPMGIARTLSALLLIWMVFMMLISVVLALFVTLFGSVPGIVAYIPDTPKAAQMMALWGSPAARLAFWVVLLEGLLTTMAVAVMLRRMLRCAMRGEPFVPANVTRLRIVAGAYAVAFATKNLLPLVAPVGFNAFMAGNGWSNNLGDLGPMMIALVLAEVFSAGIRLRDDVEMTV